MCSQSACDVTYAATESGVFIFSFCAIIMFAHIPSQRETEREAVSRTCKFLSVCGAAAVLQVM